MHRHVEVYIDESGDLGFSKKSSRFFVVVAVTFPEPEKFSRTIKRICRRRFSRHERSMEFKFNRSSVSTRRLVLDGIAAAMPSISWTAVLKECASADLRNDKDWFYAFMCSDAVSGLIGEVRSRSVQIILDRRSDNRSVRKGIDSWLTRAVQGSHRGHFPPEVTVRYADSMTCTGIQAADFVAGAVFQSLERSNDVYLERLRDGVVYGRIGL